MYLARLLTIGLVAGALVLASAPETPAAYPDKPITIIVPFGAGGAYGRLGRKMGADLEKKLGVPVVVKNNPGAGGRKGAVVLFKSKPDGYTIGFVHFISFQSNEILRGKKASIDYNRFKIILKLTDAKQFVYVNKKSPIKSLADLKKAGRAIKFATTGVGAVTWVEANALGATLGFPVKFVTGYKNLPKAALAVARGDAEAGAGGYVHVRNVLDDLRMLAFIADKKDPNLPDVPTTTELGYPQLSVLGVPRIVGAPPGTPDDRLQVIRKAMREIVADAAFKEWALKGGFFLNPEGPDATWKVLKANAEIMHGLKPLLTKKK